MLALLKVLKSYSVSDSMIKTIIERRKYNIYYLPLFQNSLLKACNGLRMVVRHIHVSVYVRRGDLLYK